MCWLISSGLMFIQIELCIRQTQPLARPNLVCQFGQFCVNIVLEDCLLRRRARPESSCCSVLCTWQAQTDRPPASGVKHQASVYFVFIATFTKDRCGVRAVFIGLLNSVFVADVTRSGSRTQTSWKKNKSTNQTNKSSQPKISKDIEFGLVYLYLIFVWLRCAFPSFSPLGWIHAWSQAAYASVGIRKTYAGLALTFLPFAKASLALSLAPMAESPLKTLLPAPLPSLSAGSAQIVGRKQLQTRSVRFELCFATVGDLKSAPNTNSARSLSVFGVIFCSSASVSVSVSRSAPTRCIRNSPPLVCCCVCARVCVSESAKLFACTSNGCQSVRIAALTWTMGRMFVCV